MLTECHGHIILDGADYRKATGRHQDGLKEDVIRQTLYDCAQQGIGFYRDGGDSLGASAFAASVASQYGIDYRTPVFAIYKNGHYGGMFGKGFDTIAQYEQLIGEVKDKGGDFIKIMVSGIMVFNTYGKLQGGTLEQPLIHDMVQAAHEAGFAVMAHVNTARQIAWALEAGADSIEHGYYMDEGCLALCKASGAVWVPTFAPVEAAKNSGQFSRPVLERILKHHRDALQKAVDMDVLIGCGSDAGSWLVPPATGCQIEWQLLEQAVPAHSLQKLKRQVESGNAMIMKKFKAHQN